MIEWFLSDWKTIGGIILSVILVYAVLITLIKVNGLRSFSKMSGHDFAITVAIGSILAATVVAKDPPILNFAIAVGSMLILQTILSKFRMYTGKTYFENEPLLIMEGSKILDENLKKANMTKDDLISKLREANVLNYDEVHVVVMEVTGDVSVLHGQGDFDREKLLHGVRTNKKGD